MRRSDFDYHLPESLIAQHPANPRDAARLFCLGRASGEIQHRLFHELPELLLPGDTLVVNNSKVLAARLIGKRESGGVCELLLLREHETGVWEALAKPGKRMRPGDVLHFGDDTLTAEILSTLPGGGKMVKLRYDTATIFEKLDQFGCMPLPPYIKEQLHDNSEYQTVYAKAPGSAAAPTAGLHFTDGLLAKIKETGVQIAEITLHVGLGTFLPVKEDEIDDHVMHSEYFILDETAANILNKTRKSGGRVVAVGTTSCRTLESVATRQGLTLADGEFSPAGGETDIFIKPGYEFKAIDGLITNFHLPESTLLMLVAAFCGYENMMRAYREAVEREYRFFSFGDAMYII